MCVFEGVCRVCARVKREKRRHKSKQTGETVKPSHLWKQLSVGVRQDLEKQFKAFRTWLHEGGNKSNRDISAEYRRIEEEEGWISHLDGDLRDHYKNWSRRLEK